MGRSVASATSGRFSEHDDAETCRIHEGVEILGEEHVRATGAEEGEPTAADGPTKRLRRDPAVLSGTVNVEVLLGGSALVLHGTGYGAARRRHGNTCDRITTPFQKWTNEVGPRSRSSQQSARNP